MSERTQKLVSIRRRTDHDLLILVHRELDRGVTLAGLATSRNSPFFAQAEKAHQRAMVWLDKIPGLSQDDRARIESRLKNLRSCLDQVPAYAHVRSLPAWVAS
jgi:hypothetical protein